MKSDKSKKSNKGNPSAKSDKKPESKGKVVSIETKTRTGIDANATGAELAEAVAQDSGAEVTARMSPNGKCHVTTFTHGKYELVIMTFPNGRVMVKATLCENAIFNVSSRVFVATDDTTAAAHARRFVRLAFLKNMPDKALQVPYFKSAKEPVDQ